MKRLLLAVVMVAVSSASAANISGTLNAEFKGFNEFGVPTTTVSLTLSCGLTCDPSAPVLTYSSVGLGSYFASDPMTSTGAYIAFAPTFFSTGVSTRDTTAFHAGTRFVATANSATCFCGNRTGEGGYVDVTSNVAAIPPWISVPTRPKTGFETDVLIDATPQGAETVEVVMSGAGISLTKTLGPADFSVNGKSSKPASVRFKPTTPGTVTVTATLNPGNASLTKTFEVLARDTSGTGGGSGSSGGSTEPEPAAGCSAVPGVFPLAALMMMLLRRARRC